MIRVVQWATGGVGCRAVPAVVDHPDLEFVGALVYDDAKAGRDLGEVCGIDPIGVTTTQDPAQIHRLEADTSTRSSYRSCSTTRRTRAPTCCSGTWGSGRRPTPEAPALTVEHVTRMAGHTAPEWPLGQGWKVTIEGMPSMVLESHIAAHGEDGNDHGLLGTAMHAVHAVMPVCEAAPGIRTFLDLPMIVGRHVLRRPRAGMRD